MDLVDFSLSTVLGHPRRADAKTDVKTIRANCQLLCPKFVSALKPRVTPNVRLGFSIFLIRPTFVCATLFPEIDIKLNLVYSRKQSCTYKSAILAEI